MTSCQPPIDLSAIVLFDDRRRILLQHRTDDAPTFPGYWSFFGGHVDGGETLVQAAVREAREELSYTLKAPLHWLSQPFLLGETSYTQHVFLERYDGTPLTLGEGQGMNWFAPRDTEALLMSAHAKAAVAALDRWFALGLAHPGPKA